MGTTLERLQRRNREMGSKLAEARQRQRRSVAECSRVIETSRRRYTAMERGEAVIGAAELETIMRYLGVPGRVMYGEDCLGSGSRQVMVPAHPGETLYVVVEVSE